MSNRLAQLAIFGLIFASSAHALVPIEVVEKPLERVMGDERPLEATYDPNADTITLVWDPEAGATYTIYQDAQAILEFAGVPPLVLDVSDWEGGVRIYEVGIDVDGQERSRTARAPVVSPGPVCWPVGADVSADPLWVYPGIYWECLPA